MYMHGPFSLFRSAVITMLRSEGTESAPTAVTTGDYLGQIYGGGYDGSNYQGAGAEMGFQASQNWSVGANGTSWFVTIVPNNASAATNPIPGIIVAPNGFVPNVAYVAVGNTQRNPPNPVWQFEMPGSGTAGSSAHLGMQASAPTDANIQVAAMVPWTDEVGSNLKFRSRHSDGSLHVVTVPEEGSRLFAILAACSGALEGRMAAISDSTTNVLGATITGGGTNHVLAYCDGTSWTVAAK
jgi:hypothetical protein